MFVIRRVTVLFALVPEIETIGTCRSASRIQVGGVALDSARRALQRAKSRTWPPVRWADRDGDTSRVASASAASATGSARSAPIHGNVTIQGPGSEERR